MGLKDVHKAQKVVLAVLAYALARDPERRENLKWHLDQRTGILCGSEASSFTAPGAG